MEITTIAKPTCKMEGCTISVSAREMCSRHYTQWYNEKKKKDRELSRQSRENDFVALTPQELPAAQAGLAEWCDRKIASLKRELREILQNIRIGKERKWRISSWKRIAKLRGARIRFYKKIGSATQAGYLLIPNFPIEVFAIRVKPDAKPKKDLTTSQYKSHEQSPARLPSGTGEYVSPSPIVFQRTLELPNKKGELEKTTQYWAEEFQAVAFPVAAVKPAVLDATQRAMALKIFDSLGLVGAQMRSDPIVVGRIVDPRSTKYNRRFATFFIAWWLNPETL